MGLRRDPVAAAKAVAGGVAAFVFAGGAAGTGGDVSVTPSRSVRGSS